MRDSMARAPSFSPRGRGDSRSSPRARGDSSGMLRAPSFMRGRSTSDSTGGGWKAQHLTVHIARVNGSFGLQLNDHNRVTQVKEGSPAEEAKLKPFDRITKVDGMVLGETKLAAMAAGKEGLMLDIERPPACSYKAIVDHENQPGSAPFGFDGDKKEAEPEIPAAVAAALAPGKQIATVVLSREPDGQFGLEVSLDNEVIAVDVDSAAHKAGLQVKDKITKVDSKPLNGPIAEVLMSKGVSQNMVLTVLRGHSVNARLSVTPVSVAADL